MSENEYDTRMCVRFAWTAKEQKARRKRAAAMQEKLLLSIVALSIDSGPADEDMVPRADVACAEQDLRCSAAVEDHPSTLAHEYESLPA